MFQLGNIPPAPRGVPQIEVTFDIDANGILNVTAKDRATNNEQKITITSSSGLSKDEVEKMARDAESHAADDRKQRDTIEARNRADAMVYNVEKTLKEHRDKIGDAEAKEIEDGARRDQEGDARGRSGQDQRGDGQADARPATSWPRRCTSRSQRRPDGAAEPAPGGGSRPAQASGEKKKDNVVDAEFVDVDDKK